MPRARVAITIQNRTTSGPEGRRLRAPSRDTIERALNVAVSERGLAGRVVLDVVWVSDDEMMSLNKRFTRKTGTTDVLAFADGAPDPDSGDVRLGEVICNLDVARAQANVLGHSFEAEAVLYAVHGLVHLLGGRDDDAEGRAEMRQTEKKALAAAGLRIGGGEWEAGE